MVGCGLTRGCREVRSLSKLGSMCSMMRQVGRRQDFQSLLVQMESGGGCDCLLSCFMGKTSGRLFVSECWGSMGVGS